MSAPTRSVHRLARAGVAVSLAVSLLASPVTASAVTRSEVMKRASTWTDKRIPYSQKRSYQGYRTDCSGFVSMAWGLDGSLTTWTLPEVSRPIKKSELKPGDVLLHRTTGRARHVVLFGGWANKEKTRYIGYEHNGPVGYAVRRVIPYPFFFDKSKYKPYRFKDITDRPVVQTAGYIESVRGSDRYTTAVRASGKAFRKGTVDTVVVASGSSSTDALVASSLAGAHGGPLLLVRPDKLHGEVLSEIRRLGASKIIVVGGKDAVSPAVAKELERSGAKVRRIDGRNRYDTSARVAVETVRRLEADREFHYDGTVILANALRPVDAVPATPLASKKAWPILLTHPGRLSPETAAAIKRIGVNRAVVLGSATALSSRTAREAGELAAGNVERVGKGDRYSTSVAVAELARREGLGVEKAAVVTDAAGADAVAVGVAQGAQDSVLMVTRKDKLSGPVEAAIGRHGSDIGAVRVVGGDMRGEVREHIARKMGAPVIDE
ncbi:MAG: cell wall-binding repeat-containing protein [Coriobacteriia bacterium]|nr:cell wall-binding repeat-containing protein [Coriobacteriia bacterium]